MDIGKFRNRIIANHPGEPQKMEGITIALREIERGLNILVKLGYVFHLEEGIGEPIPDYPKLMFHYAAAPNGRIVRSKWEEEELGAGWFDNAAEAQEFDGLETQFAGRGGVPRSGVPAIGIPTSLEDLVKFQEDARREKEQRIREFKLERDRHNAK